MAPKKKKIPITGYAIFVRETRENYQRKGWHFPKNNQDAFTFVAPLWKKLSEEERTGYNNRAKEEKRQGASDLEAKFNAIGTSFAEMEAEKSEKLEFQDIMQNTIKNQVQDADFNTVFKTQKFYLCHVNFFYVNSNGIYKPAEIALSEFNLKSGVTAKFHAFINPGPIETGYRFNAIQKMEATHNIPIEDPTWTQGEIDHVKLFNKIKAFLCKDSPNGRPPPIYTMPDDERNNFSISAIRSTFETLCEACNEEPSEFRIYELPYLYLEFRIKALRESPIKRSPEQANMQTLSVVLNDLERDKFCYTKGISCKFHEDKDLVNFCSLSVVVRWVFTMCDYLLNYIPEELVSGGHAPVNNMLAKQVYNKDEDGFELVAPLRKPKMPVGGAISYASAMRNNSTRSSGLQPAPPLPTQLRFQTPSRRLNTEDDDTPSSVYEDAESSLLSPNLSQNTVNSGYTASASLSQSSFASDISNDVMRNFGRGRGGPRLPSGDINWALNAGRGSRLRAANQRTN